MRLERKRPVGGLRRVLSGVLEANDIVSALIDNWIVTELHPTAGQLFLGMSILCWARPRVYRS